MFRISEFERDHWATDSTERLGWLRGGP